ncbi:115aa long hypothetical protein [Pyrococcus horikoshii OT3]|uniref:Uncharacterized protein n=1 Tax=Pyrococcus horikoshii (strain ATCC 700860 / DSM 12428 / JCM 9974 / NBRC 100139 / OT-3) TaxID=70601 RepID=O58700_PYRHO|nr:115aa long hypothetical protein [Pyrococcus horikoshii OT3]
MVLGLVYSFSCLLQFLLILLTLYAKFIYLLNRWEVSISFKLYQGDVRYVLDDPWIYVVLLKYFSFPLQIFKGYVVERSMGRNAHHDSSSVVRIDKFCWQDNNFIPTHRISHVLSD